MKFTMTKMAAAMALAMAANGAHAVAVTGMTIGDTVDSNTSSSAGTITPDTFGGGTASGYVAGADGPGTDGISGAFRFAPINLDVYTGSNLWFGNLGGGVINMAGGAPLDFSTGFTFAGGNFQPFNSGAITASINDTGWAIDSTNHAADLSINIAGWAGFYTSASFTFNLTPDAGTLVVDNLYKTGANTYAYRLHFQHDITSADDPSLSYTAFTARWVLEGTMVAVPEPSTYGMMAAGLGLVGMAARRRRGSKKA